MRRLTFLITFLCCALPAQGASPLQQELAKLSAQLAELQQSVKDAQQRAKGAESEEQVKESELGLLDLSHALKELSKDFASRTAKICIDPVVIELDQAIRLPELSDAEKATAKVEARLAASAEEGEPQPLLWLARFKLADVMKQRAAHTIKVERDDRNAAKTLTRAIKVLERITKDCPDDNHPQAGTSTHAAARSEIIKLHALLFEGYYRLSNLTKSFKSKARKERTAALDLLEQLGRINAKDLDPQGRSIVEMTRAEVARILGG